MLPILTTIRKIIMCAELVHNDGLSHLAKFFMVPPTSTREWWLMKELVITNTVLMIRC